MQGNDAVPVRHRRNMPGSGNNGLTHLGRKFLQIPHGGVLPKNHPAILFRINLQRVTLINNIDSKDLVLLVHRPLDDGYGCDILTVRRKIYGALMVGGELQQGIDVRLQLHIQIGHFRILL